MLPLRPTLKKLDCVVCQIVFFSQSQFRNNCNFRNPFYIALKYIQGELLIQSSPFEIQGSFELENFRIILAFEKYFCLELQFELSELYKAYPISKISYSFESEPSLGRKSRGRNMKLSYICEDW